MTETFSFPSCNIPVADSLFTLPALLVLLVLSVLLVLLLVVLLVLFVLFLFSFIESNKPVLPFSSMVLRCLTLRLCNSFIVLFMSAMKLTRSIAEVPTVEIGTMTLRPQLIAELI